MADKINTYSRAGVDVGQTRHRGVARPGAVGETKSPAAGPGPAKTDAVDFSSTVTSLKKIEARLRELPDVDRARVDELRQQVESGEFQVDARSVAAKLLRLERELG